MDVLSSLSVIAVVSLLAAISPGPDFFIVLRNSLVYSRKTGMYTTLGVGLALFFHLFYTLIGIGVLIAESVYLYHFIKYAGIAYLFYIGCKSVMDSFQASSSKIEYVAATDIIPPSTAIKQGFLTNLLNPKAAMFFISLFSQFIEPGTPFVQKLQLAGVNWIVTMSWFLFLAYVVTGKRLMSKINQFRTYVDRVMGGALILLSFKLLLV